MYVIIWLKLSCSLLCSIHRRRRRKNNRTLFCLLIIFAIVFYVYRKLCLGWLSDKCCFCLYWLCCWDFAIKAFIKCAIATKTIIWLFNRNHNSRAWIRWICVYACIQNTHSKTSSSHQYHIHSVYVLSSSSFFGLHATSTLSYTPTWINIYIYV